MVSRFQKARSGLLLSIVILVGFINFPTFVHAQTDTPVKELVLYLFYGDGCPHCAAAKPYFEDLAEKYDGVILRTFEVYYNTDNQQIFNEFARKFQIDQLGVPTLFVGPYYLPGYSEDYNEAIEAVLVQCLQEGCVDAGEGIGNLPLYPNPTTPSQQLTTPTQIATIVTATPVEQPPEKGVQPTTSSQPITENSQLEIPLIGTVDLTRQSTLVSTILIAFVDSFNPCSLWVLSMLMALTIHTGSRKKILIIGFIFLSVTSLIYALFIAGLFSVLRFASLLGWVRIVVALIALFFGLINIKDYFWYKEGLSLTIADDKKKGILKSMRKVMSASQSFWGLVGATILLAAGVSLVEFSCTAGLPVVWVNLLNSQNIHGMSFVLFLLLYMIVYQVETIFIFSSAVISLRASKIQEKQGRILKLIGGVLMLTLSVVMIINPALMNALNSSLLVFGYAFVATVLILLLHRVVLPKLGFHIGNDDPQ